ncbi:C10 family peptidase, partial [candidate division KSB1 bacterium]|nr:C10 family peptidase [candidate division KSB1 bacterium]
MFKMRIKHKGWYLFILFCLIPYLLTAKSGFSNQARWIAENWIRFVVDRDGHWGESPNPILIKFTEFKRGDMLLGYYAAVKPRGYIIVSLLKDFAPIKAYSTVCNLNPDDDEGMCALIKDDLESRNMFLIEAFGGLDETSLKDLHIHTPDSYRRAWEIFSREGSATTESFQSMQIQAAGPVGPLLKSKWGQGPPFNNNCPDICEFNEFNNAAKVGCVPLAMAQIMRHFCWPPFFGSEYYDWPNTLVNQAKYDATKKWYNDEHNNPWTLAQINAV